MNADCEAGNDPDALAREYSTYLSDLGTENRPNDGKIEQLLQRTEPQQREALLRDLIRIELDRAEGAEDSINVQEYVDRFPQYQTTVDEVLKESAHECKRTLDTDANRTVDFSFKVRHELGDCNGQLKSVAPGS